MSEIPTDSAPPPDGSDDKRQALRLSTHSSAQERRHLVALAVIVAAAASVYPLLARSSHMGTCGFHSTMETVGGLIGLVVGLALVARFYALGYRFHLFLGLAFFVNGAEDFVHGLLAFGSKHAWFGLPASSLEQFVPGTYVTGRLLLGVILLLAPFAPAWLGPSADPKRETRRISLIVLAATVAATILAFRLPLPRFIFPGQLISRPVDFLSAIVLLAALIVFVREYRRGREMLTWWIALSLGMNVVGQVMMSFSKALFDPFFDIAHVYKVLGYAIPLLGSSLCQILILTERKRAEEALQEAHDELEQRVEKRTTELSQANVLLKGEIGKRERIQDRQMLARRVLERLNSSDDLSEILRETLLAIKELTACDAAGIRLQEGEDFPYFVSDGFSDSFVSTEHSLLARDEHGEPLRDADGKTVLECMCGHILLRRFDPSKPFFTAGGTFVTGSTTDLLASTTDEDRGAHTRSRCHAEGYESVALMPLRAGEQVLGLLQLNARRRDCFSRDLIEFLEDLAQNIGVALGRRQAEERVKRQRHELSVVNAVALGISESLDLDTIANDALQQTIQALSADGSDLFMLEPDGETLARRYCQGVSERHAEVLPFIRMGEGVTGLAAQRREAATVAVAQYEVPRLAEALKREGVAHVASAPVLVKGQVIGVLSVLRRTHTPFTKDDLHLLQSITNHLAVAVDNARVYAETERRLIRLRVLHDIDRVIVSGRGLSEVLDAVLQHIPSSLGADAVAVSLFDGDTQRAPVFAMRLPNGTTIDEEAFSLAESLLTDLMEARKPVIIHNLAADPRVQMYRDQVRQHNLNSYLGVPMVARDRTTGVLHILTTRPAVFGEEDVDFFRTLAGQAGVAIENARLFEELTLRAEEMELLHQVGRAALERLDLGSMQRVVLGEITGSGFAEAGGAFVGELADLREGEPCVLTLEAHAGVSERLAQQLERLHVEEMPIAALAALRRRAQAMPVEEFPLSTLREAFVKEGIKHLAMTPLMAGDRLPGVLAFGRREPRPFTTDDLRVLDVIGAEMGVAVHNQQLYEDLQRSNEELRQTQQQVLQEERLRALGEMASGIAHDINNALSPVFGFSELLLQRGGWDEKTERQLTLISTSARDIAAIVARLREFYRKRDEREPLFPVNVSSLITHAVDLTQPRWRDIPQERGVVIQVRTEIADDDLPRVAGVEGELREALTNLIINAVDAMPDGGELWLRARVEEPWVVLEVADTGIGMTEEVRRRCLEPFFSTKGEGGTGMGLSVVYGIISRHDGEVDIHSVPGEGTTFILRLPLAHETAPGVELKPITVPPARILCVDDEPLVRELLSDTLSELGHTVEVADGGQAGIDAFAAREFDVVITDLGMPEVDGRAVAAAVKQRSPATPVILLTGWGTRMQAEEEIPGGIDVVVSKPAGPRQLQRALVEALQVTGRP